MKHFKQILALMLAVILLTTGCSQKVSNETSVAASIMEHTEKEEVMVTESSTGEDKKIVATLSEDIPQVTSLADQELRDYLDELIYASLIEELDSDKYFVSDISTVYISNEYLEELEYNSKTNVYFGYSLAAILEQFHGQKFAFTLAQDGSTGIEIIKDYEDNTLNQIIKNVAVGTGVILICVTVSSLTAGLGAPVAMNMVFAAAADSAMTMAASGALFAGVPAAIVKGIETGNFEEAIKAGALAASDGFKWGAISGAATGGIRGGVDAAKRAKEYQKLIEEASTDWRKAELRAMQKFGDDAQVSFLDGEVVKMGTPGSTRPDVVRQVGTHMEAIEVKYYNLESAASRSELYRELEREVADRVVQMPSGSTQRIVLDVTDKGVSKATAEAVKKEIQSRLAEIYPKIPVNIVGL